MYWVYVLGSHDHCSLPSVVTRVVYPAILSVGASSPAYQSDVERVPTSLHGAVNSLGSFRQ